MKKAFISVAFAAALFFGASAQTVPSWYSYQGVSTDYKNQTVTLVFYIIDPADADTPVYVEKFDNVKTNSVGAFSCQLGLGAPETRYESKYSRFDEIDWTAGQYVVETWIGPNADNVSLLGTPAQLGSVPYATVAGKALGVEGIDGNLNETIEDLYKGLEQKDEYLTQAINAQALVDEEQNANIEELYLGLEQKDEHLTQAINAQALVDEEQNANIEELYLGLEQKDEYLTQAINAQALVDEEQNANIEELYLGLEQKDEHLTQAMNAQALVDEEQNTAIETLQIQIANLGGESGADLTAVNARIDALETEVNTNITAISELEDMRIAFNEWQPGVDSQITKLLDDNEINITAISELEDMRIAFNEWQPGVDSQITKLLEDNETNITAISELEDMRIAFNEWQPGIDSQITKLNNEMEGIYEMFTDQAMAAINSLNAGLTAAEDDIAALKEDITVLKEKSATQDDIATLRDLIDMQGRSIAALQRQIYDLLR